MPLSPNTPRRSNHKRVMRARRESVVVAVTAVARLTSGSGGQTNAGTVRLAHDETKALRDVMPKR